jgi:monoamine oxidase
VTDAVDVAIVGAGLAGASAAHALRAAGASLCVLEARDRVGGRTFSRTVGERKVDMGAHYVGPGQTRILRLLGDHKIATTPTPTRGGKLLEFRGRTATYPGRVPGLRVHDLLQIQLAITLLDRAARRVDPAQPWAAPRAAEWDAQSAAAFFARVSLDGDARAMLNHTIRMTFGVEASEMSLLHLLGWIASSGDFDGLTGIEGGSVQDGIADGAQTLSQRLLAPLGDAVALSAPVRRIAQDADGVTLESDAGVLRARYAIVAVPPLLAGRIAWAPALPALRDGLTQRFPMGAAIKCIALYERAFWRERGLSGEAVSDRGPAGYVLADEHGEGGPGELVVFIEGETARVWSARPPEERRRAVLADLARIFGPEAGSPADYVDQDWCAEPWTLGCSAGVLPAGVLSQFGPALRQPVGRLHWAGSETAREWYGFMEGALESGERAAAEVLARV